MVLYFQIINIIIFSYVQDQIKSETLQYTNGDQNFSVNDGLSNIGESGTPQIMNNKFHNDSTGGKGISKEINYSISASDNSGQKVGNGYLPGSNNKISSPCNFGSILGRI